METTNNTNSVKHEKNYQMSDSTALWIDALVLLDNLYMKIMEAGNEMYGEDQWDNLSIMEKCQECFFAFQSVLEEQMTTSIRNHRGTYPNTEGETMTI